MCVEVKGVYVKGECECMCVNRCNVGRGCMLVF